MSSAAPTRRASPSKKNARLRKRYAAERRFRLAGLFAVGLSAFFLAFLLFDMSWKGLGGFTQYQAAITIDFPRSDLMLDPAAIKGPDAKEVVAGADIEGALAKAASAIYGPAAENMFGAAAVRSVGRQLVRDPGLLKRSATLWLPVGSKVDVAAKQDGDAASEGLVEQLKAKTALRRTINRDFLTES
uniref:DUF3333 domain-containing protein n=1 Tax=Sphingomonas sp. TaxID=28214 RepID=UPI00286A9151